MFDSYQLRQRITKYNGQNFNWVHSFLSIATASTTMYYVTSYHGSNVLIYNEYWEYQRIVNLQQHSSYSAYINDEIYITGDDGVKKYDKELNLIARSNEQYSYRGIYFNNSNDMIFMANCLNHKIDKFNQSLSLVDSISIPFMPWIITSYNGMMVISDDSTSGIIFFYKDGISTQTITTICGNRVNSILFDNYDHMIVLCGSYVYIYHTNGTYTGIGMNVFNESIYMNFDSKDRLIILGWYDIKIFY